MNRLGQSLVDDAVLTVGDAAGHIGASLAAHRGHGLALLLLKGGVNVEELPAARYLIDTVDGQVRVQLVQHVGQRSGARPTASDDEDLVHGSIVPFCRPSALYEWLYHRRSRTDNHHDSGALSAQARPTDRTL